MIIWLGLMVFTIILSVLFFFWKRAKQIQQVLQNMKKELHTKDVELHTKDAVLQIQKVELENTNKALYIKDRAILTKDMELNKKEEKIGFQQIAFKKLKTEKYVVEAKYQKKLKAAEVKKKNLAKYRKKKKDIRSVQQQIEDIIGKGSKWLPHSCQEPRSHRIGKPKGAKGGGRKRPTKIHQTIDLYPQYCPGCNTSLEEKKANFVYDKVLTELFRDRDDVDCFDILRIRHIKQRIHRRKCSNCKCWVLPDQGLFKNARFGVGLIAHVITKRIRLSMAYEDILGDMEEHFGNEFSLSVTSIINWFYRFEVQIRDIYEQLEELLKQEIFAHFDETGLPMQGKNWWLWIVCTANLVLYKQSHTRGHVAINDIMEGFKGTIVADFFSAYEKFDGNEHQKCLAHLLSAIIELIVGLQKENERIQRKIQKHEESVQREEIAARTATIAGPQEKKTRGRKPKPAKLKPEQLQLVKDRYAANLTTVVQASDLAAFFRAPFQDSCFSWKKPPNERISIENAQDILTGLIASIRDEGVTEDILNRLLNRCEKYMPSLFTYLQYEGMPPDNNLAERDLRKFAKQRKISNDFKSVDVTKHLVEYLSLYMTCKVNGRDFHLLLDDLLRGNTVDLREFLFAVA
jgi:hypothetical protein